MRSNGRSAHPGRKQRKTETASLRTQTFIPHSGSQTPELGPSGDRNGQTRGSSLAEPPFWRCHALGCQDPECRPLMGAVCPKSICALMSGPQPRMTRPGKREPENPLGVTGPHRALQVHNIRFFCRPSGRPPARPAPRSGPCDPPLQPTKRPWTDTVAGPTSVVQAPSHGALRISFFGRIDQGMTSAAENPQILG